MHIIVRNVMIRNTTQNSFDTRPAFHPENHRRSDVYWNRDEFSRLQYASVAVVLFASIHSPRYMKPANLSKVPVR